jgi:hypothetical protein
MHATVIFRGDSTEHRDLDRALGHNCTCGYPRCAAHEMRQRDQRVLDGLLFVRRALRGRLVAAEFTPA